MEKAFDRVLRVLIESSLRRKGVVECYVKAVIKMYQEVLSHARVGIHQGSILSPFIFAVVMDVLPGEVAKEGHAMMYTDDLVLICETKEEARQRFVV